MATVYTVGQINKYIKNMFQQDFVLNRISVGGEISNCKYHTSGHIYFTLKDDTGTILCVMFAGNAKKLALKLQNGQKVVCKGRIDIYERDGKYQLYVEKVEAVGTGELYRRFEELKQRLEEMGMFAAEYKKPIPRFACRIGIVTASTGAAVQDIIHIATRRNPYVQLILYPAVVQGSLARHSIVQGIRTLDAMQPDVIIVGRGGGSIEDLWAFNEEEVARAIFDCETPIISAVGHETDFTIADFVADLRAPTPSAAAELAVVEIAAVEKYIDELEARFHRALSVQIQDMRQRLEKDTLLLERSNPVVRLNENRQYTVDLEERLIKAMDSMTKQYRHKLALYSERLEGHSPLKVIRSGYGYVEAAGHKPVRSIRDVAVKDKITVSIQDGCICATVDCVERRDCFGKDGNN